MHAACDYEFSRAAWGWTWEMQTLIIKVALHLCSVATPWVVARQVPLSMGFSKQEYWTGSPCSPPGPLPDPGVDSASLVSAKAAGRCFTTWTTWEPTLYLLWGWYFPQLCSVFFFVVCACLCFLLFFNFYFINVTSFKMLGIQKLAQCSKWN